MAEAESDNLNGVGGTQRGVDAWRRRLSGAGAPIFARTVGQVTAVARDDDASAKDLSNVIGHDAAMTARLLRIASSTLFNLQGRKIDTISTAVVLIGFDAVRELAVSLALIEHVLNGRAHTRVTHLMATSFHAAAQAKSLAGLLKVKNPEEVFVATLLLRLGEMSFWSADTSEVRAVEQLVEHGLAVEDAEGRVLGFQLPQLTAALSEEWNLSPLLVDVLSGEDEPTPAVRSVQLGHEIAQIVAQQGWEAEATRALLKQIAEQLDMTESALRQRVQTNMEDALSIAESYGVPSFQDVLQPAPSAERAADEAGEASLEDVRARHQLRVLQEIDAGLQDGSSLDELVTLALDGLYEGAGFDRAYLALLSADYKSLVARYALGMNPEGFVGSQRRLKGKGDLFALLLEQGEARKVSPGDRAASPDYVGWIAYSECVVMPLVINERKVGLLYADRAASRVSIDDQAQEAFKHFGLQIVKILSGYRRKA